MSTSYAQARQNCPSCHPQLSNSRSIYSTLPFLSSHRFVPPQSTWKFSSLRISSLFARTARIAYAAIDSSISCLTTFARTCIPTQLRPSLSAPTPTTSRSRSFVLLASSSPAAHHTPISSFIFPLLTLPLLILSPSPSLHLAAALYCIHLAFWLDIVDLQRAVGHRRGYDKGASEVGPCLEQPLSQQKQSDICLMGVSITAPWSQGRRWADWADSSSSACIGFRRRLGLTWQRPRSSALPGPVMLADRQHRCANYPSKRRPQSLKDVTQVQDARPPVPTVTRTSQDSEKTPPTRKERESTSLSVADERDAGVSDEVWNQLEADKNATDLVLTLFQEASSERQRRLEQAQEIKKSPGGTSRGASADQSEQ